MWLARDPEFHPIAISIHSSGTTDGWFDARKMERVFQNLATQCVRSGLSGSGQDRDKPGRGRRPVSCNSRRQCGRGIPELVRGRLFEPFVSQGRKTEQGLDRRSSKSYCRIMAGRTGRAYVIPGNSSSSSLSPPFAGNPRGFSDGNADRAVCRAPENAQTSAYSQSNANVQKLGASRS